MEHIYDYVIVGGGLAGASAVQSIRGLDAAGRILLACEENHLPYDWSPLSKRLWFGKKKVEDNLLGRLSNGLDSRSWSFVWGELLDVPATNNPDAYNSFQARRRQRSAAELECSAIARDVVACAMLSAKVERIAPCQSTKPN